MALDSIGALALRSACAIAAALQRRLASPKPLRLGHAQAREAAWHGARLNRGCGFASAKTVQVEAMAELVRKWPKRSPFSMQSKLKQGWLRRSPSVSAMSKQGKRLDMALDSIGALALRSACAIFASFLGKCNRECQQYWKHLKPVTGLR